ncbi:MAG: membrane protein insertase YidC [Candidatus Limivicinus sp.]|jgi:YidC/Oxa1 family membrane protein insertase
MSFPEVLLTFFIKPLEALLELVYIVAYRLTNNPGISIIGMSLIMNLLLLPLYNRTDAIQAEAIETEKRLKPYVKHIKKTFKGNEQFMMLQTCYRQNNYKPTDALKGLSPLLLEIPFFMAAYNFLSGLGLLSGAAFGPISDLGTPDGLISAGGLSVNLLPILMTLINVISGIIYTKDAPAKTKVQLYGMAALFLVLLYNAPAGLAFYWTLNNLFSLVKNVFIRLKNPKLVLGISSSVLGIAGLIYVIFIRHMNTLHQQIVAIALLILLQLPLILYFARKNSRAAKAVEISKKEKLSFFLGCTFLTLLLGALIPSAVIKSSPAEFVDFTMKNPLINVLHNFLLCAGLFMLWLNVFYTLAKPAGKRIMALAVWLVSGTALIDYMFFGTHYGTLTHELKFVKDPQLNGTLINLAVILALVVLMYLIWRKKAGVIHFVYDVLGLAVIVMSLINVHGIQEGYVKTVSNMNQSQSNGQYNILPMSKNGKNVVVIMLDKAINGYFPYIMAEKPELKEQFAGFTYYPNTMSYGLNTNVGVPTLFGGYEYTPENMNARASESLESKHNEALKVMPVLFRDNDFQVTVCDPALAGYQWVPDLSIYDDYPDINKYHLIGHYNELPPEETLEQVRKYDYRSFFCYSLFRASPVILHPIIYDNGSYNELVPENRATYRNFFAQKYNGSIVKAVGFSGSFLNSYNVLDSLPELTRVQDSDENTFLMMTNDSTHEPMMLQEPDYVPALYVDNTEYEMENGDRFILNGRKLKVDNLLRSCFYQCNMASMIKLGEWMDFLRENDLYDNTKIIISADHGDWTKQFDDMLFGEDGAYDAMGFNPLYLVKDFNSRELTVDYTFMTNADTPTLAAKDLIENPINPFTGKQINNEAKEGEQHIIVTSHDVNVNNGNTYLDGQWFSIHDNIFDMGNWREITDEMVS